MISAESSHWFTNEYLCVQHRWWSAFLSFIHTANTTTVYCGCLKCLSCTCAPVEIKILDFSTIVQLCSHSLTMTLKTKVSFKRFCCWRKPAVIQSLKGQFQFFYDLFFNLFTVYDDIILIAKCWEQGMIKKTDRAKHASSLSDRLWDYVNHFMWR